MYDRTIINRYSNKETSHPVNPGGEVFLGVIMCRCPVAVIRCAPCRWSGCVAHRPRPLASSKHKPQCYIFRKRKIPPVSWLLLSPQRLFAFAGSPFAPLRMTRIIVSANGSRWWYADEFLPAKESISCFFPYLYV